MLLSFVLIFGSLTIGLIRNLNRECEVSVVVGYWVVCFAMNFLITKNFMVDFKQNVSQRLKLKEQRDEFHKVLSSIPQGIMLASIKNR